jgi:uncharacterized caspase-like protein
MNSRRYLKLHGFFLAAALLLVSQPAWAIKRVALVLGNSAYQNAARLPNPINDATAVTATLKNAGFDVVDSRQDLKIADMRRALRDFADQARDADVAVIYYAGHGIEIGGTNYLIPTDATLERDTDVYDEAFSLDRVLLAIEPARQLRLVIVDACRDNPFADTMKRTTGTRSVSRGLARIEPTTSNTLVAFAAKAGLVALDGNSQNSPYTASLIRHIATPGLDLRRAFGFIRDEVLKTTGNRQEPYVYGSLGGEDVALVPAKVVAAPPNAQADARRDYELALQLGSKDALNAFLAQYPDGFYASLAKVRIAAISAEETRVAATEKARLAEQERTRLAAEGAQNTQQVKAAADAKAAEEARVAAEKTKQMLQEQFAEAERNREAADKAAIAKSAAEKLADQYSTPDKAAPVEAPQQKLAALPDPAAAASPSPSTSPAAPPSPAELAKSVQAELRRVGCLIGFADGEWNAASRRAVELFNKSAGTRLDVKLASLDAFDAIKAKPARVCPLICETGFKADGERCVKITCAAGSFLNDDNECEKRKLRDPPSARRGRDERPARVVRERPPAQANSGKPSGQLVCDRGGCRAVARGCRLEFRTTAQGGPYEGGGGNVQICN